VGCNCYLSYSSGAEDLGSSNVIDIDLPVCDINSEPHVQVGSELDNADAMGMERVDEV
jgi:hypothetical protein